MWQIVLIVASLIIAVIGWFKPEKLHRILSVTMVVLLFSVAVIQVTIVSKKQKEEDRLNARLNRVVLGNDSLLTQNTELLTQNKELLFQIDEYQGEIEEQKETVESLRDFSHVAQLNIFGTTMTVSGDADYLRITSPLSKILEGAYQNDDGKYYPLCTKTAKAKFRTAIEKYPNFPFSYYALALCKRAEDDNEWEIYADKAISIFEKTTSINGHDASHEQALRNLLRNKREQASRH